MERLGAIDEEDNWNKILIIFVLIIGRLYKLNASETNHLKSIL